MNKKHFCQWTSPLKGQTARSFMTILVMLFVTTTAWAISGEGTSSSPYVISSASDWNDFRTKVSSASTSTYIYAKQTSDFTIPSGAYTPVGTSSKPFYGNFNGNYHTITFEGATSSSDNFGLFGYVKDATIKSLKVDGTMTVSGTRSHIGGIVAFAKGSTLIYYCTFAGTLDAGSSKDCIGGIMGYAESSFQGSIFQSFCNGTLKTTSTSSDRYMGGILGYFNDENSKKPKISKNFSDTKFLDGNGNAISGTYINGIIGRIRAHADNVTDNYCTNVARAFQASNTTEATIDASNKVITINVTAGSNGSVSTTYLTPDGYTATRLQVEATPNTSYHVCWTGSDETRPTLTLTLTDDINLTANFHKLTEHKKMDATCTTIGYKYDCWECKTCGKYYKDSDAQIVYNNIIISALGHSYNTKTTTSTYLATAATCTEAAKYYFKCEQCGAKGTETYTSTDTKDKALGHSYNTKTTTSTYRKAAATCTSAAIYYYKCDRCTAKGTTTYASTDTKDKALGHSYTDKTTTEDYLATAATCTSAANYYYKCSRCTAKGTTTYASTDTKDKALGHSFTAMVTTEDYFAHAATCTSAATYYYKCDRCTAKGTATYASTEDKDKALEQGHDFTAMVTTEGYLATAATCTDAATYYYKCSHCEAMGTETYTSTDDKDRPSHQFNDADDPNHTVCIRSGCGHTFLYYTASEELKPALQPSYTSSYDNVSQSGTLDFNGQLTTIENYAFQRCTGLTELTIPNSVTTIGNAAFAGCKGLTSVDIPNSVTTIGNYAFNGCTGLTSVDIPNSVTTIGGEAFRNCSGLTSVTIGNSVTTIGGSAFNDCKSLTSVNIGNSVTSIGGSAFAGCTNLSSVGIPNSVTSIGDYAFKGCSGLESVNIGNSVTTIGNYAFQGCTGLTSVDIPNSVTTIGNYAFKGCSGLESVDIPNSVKSIGNNAFQGCTKFTSVDIPDAVKSIGANAFQGCTGLTSVNIGKAVKSIGNYAFQDCCNLTELTIGNSVTTIGDYAFQKCGGLTELTIPNSVTSIGGYAFHTCAGLTELTLPNSVTTIGSNAFNSCVGLTSVDIPNSVTSIGIAAFYGCNGLTSVDIHNSVTSIGQQAFDACESLSTITFNSIPQTGTNIVPKSCKKTLVLTDDSYVANNKGSFPTLDEAPTYTRAMDSPWGTLVVPFDVDIDQANTLCDMYAPGSMKGTRLRLTKLTGTLAAGTPVIIHMKENTLDSATGKFDLTLTSCSQTVDTPISSHTPVDGLTLTGTYATTKVAADAGYLLSNDRFGKTTAETPSTAFRAYMKGSIDTVDEIVLTDGPSLAGDLNSDGIITVKDLTLLVGILNGNNPYTYTTADVDGNGNITLDDLTTLKQKTLK